MIVYDGTYRLRSPHSGLFDDGRFGEPAWWVRVMDLSGGRGGLRFLKPWGVFATPASPGDYRTTCAQGVGGELMSDFGLEPRQVLWVEHFNNDPGHLHVAEFVPSYPDARGAWGEIRWRPIRSNELEVIRGLIPEAEFIEIVP